MSQVSPYARSTTERSQHRNATTLFAVVAGAVFFAAIWLMKPDMLFRQSQSDDSLKDTQSTIRVEEPESPSAEAVATSKADWAAQVLAIEQQLPKSSSADLVDLKRRLEAVTHVLETEPLSAEEKASIQHSLAELKQQAVVLKTQSSRRAVTIEGFAENVTSKATSIQLGEQELMRQAREHAQRDVRQRKEPVLRDARLAIRDDQDKATELRRQIAQMQREQQEFREKANRANALRRDMTDVKRYLQPFTAPGYLQPKSDRNAWDTERTADAKPVSLARLKRLGALEPTMEGLERLYIFGGGKNPVLNNSRPLGSFPQYWAQQLSKPDVLEAIKRAQQLLRDHGQALVEEQLLSP